MKNNTIVAILVNVNGGDFLCRWYAETIEDAKNDLHKMIRQYEKHGFDDLYGEIYLGATIEQDGFVEDYDQPNSVYSITNNSSNEAEVHI